jgi:ribosomal protein S18 acetylase RimI-like enzyme
MSDPALVLALESRLINAWPSFDYQFYDGWLLRLARGYSKRANSATPLVPGARLDGTLIDHMVERFLAENVRPTFRLNSLQADDVDKILSERGFEEIEPTRVMMRDLPEDCTIDPAIHLDPEVSTRWVRDTARAYGGDKSNDEVLREIVRRIRQKAAFATLDFDDRHVAWGLGVVERGWLGLYDIVVDPELRGIGLGRRVVTSLMAWGVEQRASRVYLQVREDNLVAQGLYEATGFVQAYRYTHRVMPLRARA